MPEAIPPSPYPVMGMYGGGQPPRKTLDGPYVASRPAYQMFADMARTGQSIGQAVEADHRPNEPVDFDRFNPVKEYGSRGYWFNDGVMEMLPNWPNPNNPPKTEPAAAAEPTPAAAPIAAPPPVAAPLGGPAVLPAPQIAPAAPAPTRAAPLAAPVEPADAMATARTPDADRETRTIQVSSRPASKGKTSRLAQQLARLSYAEDIPASQRTRNSQRPQVAGMRRPGTASL